MQVGDGGDDDDAAGGGLGGRKAARKTAGPAEAGHSSVEGHLIEFRAK